MRRVVAQAHRLPENMTRVSASLRNRAQAKASLQPCMHSILEAKVQEPTLLH
jgi:hypothetical protein